MSKARLRYALVIPDTHRPYHDARAYNLMLKVAQSLPSVDEVTLLGDYGEFVSVGIHPKDPDLEGQLSNELRSINDGLDQLDKLFSRAKKTFIEGNHEYRFSRFIRDKAPQLYGITTAKELLHIPERKNWKWIPYGPDQDHQILGSKLHARHEPVGSGEYVAANTVKRAGCSVIFGHVHKIQEHQVVMLNGNNHRGITPGWLGNKKHKIFNYVPNHHQWALGFAITTILPDGSFFNENIHIIDYKCTYGGKLFVG